jgi:hypothetical protein
MSIQVIVNFQVTDFDKFRTLFDARADARTAAGIEGKLYRTIDAPNSPVVIGTAPSKEAFFAFFQSPGQQAAMKDGGLVGPPQITLMEEV